MRVCMVAYTHYEEDNRVMRYAEALAARGDSVDVICLRHPEDGIHTTIEGVNVTKVQTRVLNEKRQISYLFRILLFLIRAAWTVAMRHKRQAYDLIHVHSVPDFLVFTAVYPKVTGCKVILDIHDILPEFYASKFGAGKDSPIFAFLLAVEKISAQFADHVIIANDLWRDRITKRSVPDLKCTTLLNFPDTRIFHERHKTRADDRLIILYPGSLGWHQGLDLAIRAFHRIREAVPRAEFHIYGNGGDKLKLVELVKQLDLEDRVRIRPSLPLRAIADIMANADLGVVPKRSDTFGNEAFSTKTLEFMTLGVPLIVASTAIDRHYFSDDVVRFFRSGDEEQLSMAMLELLNNYELRARLAAAGLELSSKYTWETNKYRYFSIIESLVAIQAKSSSKGVVVRPSAETKC